MYDTVIFDLDGTLLDTLEDLTDGVNHVLSERGYRTRTIDEIRSFVGHGVASLIRLALPEETDDETYASALADFRKYYTANCRAKTRPYDGVTELLAELKARGIKTAIVSNKNDEAAKTLAEYYFHGLTAGAVGGRAGKPLKPAPEAVLEAMRLLDAKSGSTLYVGDSEVDKETADNAGLDCALVAWGFRGYEFIAKLGAKRVIEKPEEILELTVKNS
ncbi:MAG: HAD family hydrolase [Oscillospiraceae bacterium]|nr:HAD family hydrolase [Oscillospiraceae bacterium]